MQKNPKGAYWKCKLSVICPQQLILAEACKSSLDQGDLYTGDAQIPLSPNASSWSQSLPHYPPLYLTCGWHLINSSWIKVIAGSASCLSSPEFPALIQQLCSKVEPAEFPVSLCSSWLVRSTFKVVRPRIPPTHLDLSFTVFWKNEPEPIAK